jgi:hypothetical protein
VTAALVALDNFGLGFARTLTNDYQLFAAQWGGSMSIQERQATAERLIFDAFAGDRITRRDPGPMIRLYQVHREGAHGESLVGQIEMNTTTLLKEEGENIGRHVSDQIKLLKRT